MFGDIARIFQKTPQVIFAAPIIFLIPVLGEGLQHVVEYYLGMFSPGDGVAPGTESNIRVIFGIVKVTTILYASMWVAKFWFREKYEKPPVLFAAREFGALGMLAAFAVLLMAAMVFLGPLLVAFITDNNMGIPQDVLPFTPLIALLPFLLWSQNLSLWWIGHFLGDKSMTQDRSRKLIKGRLNWMTMVFVIPVSIPMIAHYKLNYLSMGASLQEKILFLALDSLLVGILAVIIGNAMWVTYEVLSGSPSISGSIHP